MPVSSNGIHCGVLDGDSLFVGGGDGKVKKLTLSGGQWTLTHEAQLDSRVHSLKLSIDKQELIAGTLGGKIYRVLTNDLSFLLHSDAHCGSINDISFGQNSDWFASVDEQGSVKTWDLSEYKSLFSATPAKCGASSCFIAKDDETLLSGWRDGFIRCFCPKNKTLLWEVVEAHRGAVTSLFAD